MKDNNAVDQSIFMIYELTLGVFTAFAVYRSVDFLVFSGTWDQILSPVTLIVDCLCCGSVIVMYILLAHLHKVVKIYNGLFNMNEDKGSSDFFLTFILFFQQHVIFSWKKQTNKQTFSTFSKSIYTGLSYVVPQEENFSSTVKCLYKKTAMTARKARKLRGEGKYKK